MYQKNHTFLIDIFAKLHEKNKDTILLLIGEGELEEKIKEKIKGLGLWDSVIFTGSIPNVHEMYQMRDVFILPSLYEGLPVVGIEAQASGVPCIFSDTVTAEVKITDGVEFIPLTSDTDVWAEAILKNSKDFKRTNRKEDIIRAGYSIHTEAEKMQNLYLAMMNQEK